MAYLATITPFAGWLIYNPRRSQLFEVAYLCTIGDMQTLTEWVKNITNDASWRSIADELGTTHSTIQRRLKADTASTVIELATIYSANPVYGLLAGGCISNADLEEFHRQGDLDAYSDVELSEEIVRRLRAREQNDAFNATVFEFPGSESAPADTHDGTVTEWDGSKPAAADSSPDENEERIKRGEDPID